jgi:branched-subunit amino acid ABC-type transport system permease component
MVFGLTAACSCCTPHRGPGAVAARVGPGHHAAGDRAQLLRLPRELSEGEHAADHHALRADGLAACPILNAQTALTLFALLLVPVVGWVLYRTPLGLALRMVGENPQAAESQGVSVRPRARAPSSRARR